MFGTLNSRVYGTGVLIRQGGLQVVQSKFNGELLETKIDNNSYVRKGEVVAKIVIHDRDAELKKLKDRFNISKIKLDKIENEINIQIKAINNRYKFLRIKENFLLDSKKKDYELKKWEVKEFQKLLGVGAVSKLRYSDTMVEVNNLEAAVYTIKKSLPLLDK